MGILNLKGLYFETATAEKTHMNLKCGICLYRLLERENV